MEKLMDCPICSLRESTGDGYWLNTYKGVKIHRFDCMGEWFAGARKPPRLIKNEKGRFSVACPVCGLTAKAAGLRDQESVKKAIEAWNFLIRVNFDKKNKEQYPYKKTYKIKGLFPYHWFEEV